MLDTKHGKVQGWQLAVVWHSLADALLVAQESFQEFCWELPSSCPLTLVLLAIGYELPVGDDRHVI